jgi:GNAT superfamily N-acetyltransferase
LLCNYGKPIGAVQLFEYGAQVNRQAPYGRAEELSMPIEVTEAAHGFNQWVKLLELLHAAFAYQNGRIDPPSSLYKLDAQSLALKAGEERLFVAVEGEELIGCAFARIKPASVYVGKVAVWPARQGQGIGRLLMQAVEGFAQRTGKPIMELETRIELLENHKTFSAIGFVKVAEYSHPGYTRTTSITMQKALVPLHAEA